MIYVILNILFASYLAWEGNEIYSKKNRERRAMCDVFFCASAVCLLNAACIMASFFGKTSASTFIGMLMFFMNALMVIYLTLCYVMIPYCKNPVWFTLFKVFFIALALYLTFLRFNEVSVYEETGYVVKSDALALIKNQSNCDLFYLVYLFLLPFSCIFSCVFGCVKNISVQRRQKSLLSLLSILLCISLLVATIVFSRTGLKFAMYDTLFTFSYVLFAMLAVKLESINIKITKPALKNWLIQFSCFFLAGGLINGVVFALLSKYKIAKPALFYPLFSFCSFAVFFGSYYSFRFVHERILMRGKLKSSLGSDTEEGNALQYVKDRYDAIESPKVSMDYSMNDPSESENDVIDVIRLTKSRYVLLFGNVSNNTPETKRNMLLLKAMLRTVLLDSSDLKEFVGKINKFVFEKINMESLFKCFIAVLESDENALYYVNCGIPLVATFSKELKKVSEIQGKPCLLGIDSDISSRLVVKKIKLNSKDIVLICNDEDATPSNILKDDFRNGKMKKSVLILDYK